MKLVLEINSSNSWHESQYFFEHKSVFDAQYEILEKVSSYVDKLPKSISVDEMNSSSLGQNDISFLFRGMRFRYDVFMQFDLLPAKNALIPPKERLYAPSIVEPTIITLDQWFDSNRTGPKWDRRINSTIRK